MTAERSRPVLRALRREPLLVDDTVVAARLARVIANPAPVADASVAAPATLRGEATDRLRWARAWLVCVQAALVADERYGREDAWSIELPLTAVNVPRGGGDHLRQRQLLAELQTAGVLHVSDGARDGVGSVRISVAREVLAEHRAAIAVDWPLLVERSGAEPAQLLVARALADLVAPLDALTAVPRRDLVARTGYQAKQVRTALRRLVASGLIEAEGDAGVTARYRFSALALGRGWEGSTEDGASLEPRGVASVVAPAPANGGAASPSAATAPQPSVVSTSSATPAPVAEGVEVQIGGATITVVAGGGFQVGAGLVARAELGEDGRVRLVVGRQARET